MKRKTVSATHARIHFGEIMRHVVEQSEPVVVERSGKPLVVVLSVESYQQLTGRQRRDETDSALERLATLHRRRTSALDGDTINETINSLREERHEWFNSMP
jgi:prevent-host-death family protein